MSEDGPARLARRIDDAAYRRLLQRLAGGQGAPWLHSEIAHRMADRLPLIRLKPAVVLEWGGFFGGGDEALKQAYPRARRLVAEPTPALVTRSSQRQHKPWWSAGRWSAPAAEVIDEAAVGAGCCELLWSNMSLHAAREPAAVMARWHAVLAVDGFVMFSCFGPDTLKTLRTLYADHRWPPPAPGFIDMHDVGDMLIDAGFADPVMDQELLTLTWETPQALLAELRAIGGNLAPDRFSGLRTPRWRERLERALDQRRGADGRIALGFEIIYGHAFKPPPRAKLAAETTIGLDDMRRLMRSGRRSVGPGGGV